jgi:hypothetical protein
MEIKTWMENELKYRVEDYLDSSNILDATKLAEFADAHFFPENEDDPDEMLFELAFIVTEKVTEMEGYNQ